ncbi:MAG TPA: MFS transporter [Chloroflexota bacterium]|nr:MFS transporter [Chloroflexota bacterium]
MSSYRYNFVVLTLDGLLFWLGLAYYSPTTILPLFVSHLTPSNVVVGAVPAIVALSWSLPQLFGAQVLAALRSGRRARWWGGSRKSFVVRTAAPARIPLLVLVVATSVLAVSHPTLTLVVFFVCFGLFRGTGGLNTPVYYDLVAVAIHPRARARFIGLTQFLGGAIAAVALALGRAALDAFPFPGGFVICFAAGLVFVTLGLFCMASVREPALVVAGSGPDAEAPPGGGRAPGGILRTAARALRAEGALRRYLGARVFVALASMALAFFGVHAARDLGASDGDVALYSAVLLAAQTASALLWGAVADRFSLTPVLAAAVALAVAGTGLALLAQTLVAFGAVFALVGASLGALAVTDPGMPLALAEARGADRALYVAVANTVLAPVYVVAPLIGGGAADTGGYRLTYALAAAAGAVALPLVARTRVQAISSGAATS